MKQNKRNPDENACQGRQNAKNGSTLLGVIAAMLFIGIVTAAMLKNTGSQAAASGSYSGMHIMSSTVSSGIIATETYFRKNGGEKALLDNLKNDTVPIFGNKNGKDRPSISNSKQFFSSRIIEAGTGDNPYAIFEVNAGKSKNGKSGKRALVFYGKIENLHREQGGNSPYGAKNAIYMAGPVESMNAGVDVPIGNATFEGKMDFHRASKFGGEVYFGGPTELKQPTEGNHEFTGKTYFADDAVVRHPQNKDYTMFKNDVGFNKNLSTEGSDTLRFDGNVFINGSFSVIGNSNLGNFTVHGNNTDKKFYYADDFPVQTSAKPDKPKQAQHLTNESNIVPSTSLEGYNTITFTTPIPIPSGCMGIEPPPYPSFPISVSSNCVYYNNYSSEDITDDGKLKKLRIKKGADNYSGITCYIAGHPFCCQPVLSPNINPTYSDMPLQCVWQCDDSGDKIVCLTHPNGHVRVSSQDTYDYYDKYGVQNKNRVSGYSNPAGRESYDGDILATKNLDMAPIEERREVPQINLNNIYNSSVERLNYHQQFGYSATNIVESLNSLYKNASPSQLYNGHLVIEITGPTPPLRMPENVPFEGKVMFIIKNGGNLNAPGFYTSTGSSSTLIYADAGNASITDFDLTSGGILHGLICIDPKNTSENIGFQWGQSGGQDVTLKGAIHNFSTNKIKWNGGTSKLKVDFDPNALSQFSPLKCPDDEPNCNVKEGAMEAWYIDVSNPRINLSKASGYYFY